MSSSEDSRPSEDTVNERLCAANCGFYGHPSTKGYCSVCFQKLSGSAEQSGMDKVIDSLAAAPSAEATAAGSSVADGAGSAEQPEEEKAPKKKVQKNTTRCWSCRKKVGLLGFKCKCGYVYCSKHRIAEVHECTFDHRGVALSRNAERLEENKCVAEKITRI